MQWRIRNTFPSLSGLPSTEASESLPSAPVPGEAYLTSLTLTIQICAYILGVYLSNNTDDTYFFSS